MAHKIGKAMWEHIKEQKIAKLVEKEALILDIKAAALNKTHAAKIKEYQRQNKIYNDAAAKVRDLRDELQRQCPNHYITFNFNALNNGAPDVLSFKVDRQNLSWRLKNATADQGGVDMTKIENDFNKLMLDVELSDNKDAKALIEAFLK